MVDQALAGSNGTSALCVSAMINHNRPAHTRNSASVTLPLQATPLEDATSIEVDLAAFDEIVAVVCDKPIGSRIRTPFKSFAKGVVAVG